MTFLGGVGRALPFLLPNFVTATVVATIVVADRTARDRVDPQPLHGYAVSLRRLSGCGRGVLVLPERDPDRLRLASEWLLDQIGW